jgi:hypothetical protein
MFENPMRSLLLILAVCCSAAALSGATAPKPPPALSNQDDGTLRQNQYALELQKLQVEKQKLELESWKSHAQYELDTQKAHDERVRTIWTALSIVVSFLAGAGTLLFGILSQRSQAKLQFEMKAAEIVMDSKGPRAARTRAALLHKLFPTRLPHDLSATINVKDLRTSTTESRKELLKMLAEKSTPSEIVKYWLQIFPGDDWAKNLVVDDKGGAESQPLKDK